MLNFFKRRPKKIPNRILLDEYPRKDNYFYRKMTWSMLNDQQVVLTDPNKPRMITMDPWPQVIFMQADGTRTIQEFIEWLAGEYKGEVPTTLVKDMIDLMETLYEKEKIIELSPTKKQLPDELLNPTKK